MAFPGGCRAVCCVQASEELLKEHYIALQDRPFYGRLVKYMSSGPVVAMVSAGWVPWVGRVADIKDAV